MQSHENVGQQLVSRTGIDEQRLGGVADAGALGLGVDDDVARHGNVGRTLKVDMAVAHARLDDRHLGLAHAGLDERRAATRDEDVHQAGRVHELDGLGAVLARDELNGLGVQPRLGNTLTRRVGYGHTRVMGGRATTEHHGIATAKGERNGVGRHVGTRLVDHGDDAQRHSQALHAHTAGKGAALDDTTQRVGKGGDLTHGGRDVTQSLLREQQPVDEWLGEPRGAPALNVARVGLKDGGRGSLDGVGRGNHRGRALRVGRATKRCRGLVCRTRPV